MSYILIVEDDRGLRRMLGKIVAGLGHEVRTVGNGREATREIGRETPDLVISDVNMPEMDGIELLGWVRDHCPELPVIVMSGGGKIPKEALLADAGQLGADRTLSKPIDFAVLEEAVSELLAS